MKTTYPMEYSIGFLTDNISDFCIYELNDIITKFPELRVSHTQDFYTIIYLENASGYVVIDEFNTVVNSEKILVIKPNSVSRLRINENAKGKFICFTEDFFHLRYNNNVLNEFFFIKNHTMPYINLNPNENKIWNNIMNLLYKEYIQYAKHTKKALRSYLNIILFEFERHHQLKQKIGMNTLGKNRISEFKDLIKTHYKVKKSPSEYAYLLNITTNHLNKVCKQETKKTAGTIIRNHLCIEAQRLLYHTNNYVGEIAEELGFSNISYFSTFFKNQTGSTPEEYRKLM